MGWTLFTQDGLLFSFRFIHFFFGVIWIGLLYYFNFVQGSFFAETDAHTKSGCIQKLVPRALWWFRWGAMLTFLSGLFLMLLTLHFSGGFALLASGWGVMILTGALLGTFMWGNVWFVIWPNQKIVIQSATQMAQGGQAIPEAAAAAAQAGLMSRTNVVFSLPMLFMMGAARHLAPSIGEGANLLYVALFMGGIVLLLELNGLFGKQGPMKTVSGVITCGFVLTAVLYSLIEIAIRL